MAVDLETGSCFFSAYPRPCEDIPDMGNNWVCYDFKERMIVPTRDTIRTFGRDPGRTGDEFRCSFVVEDSEMHHDETDHYCEFRNNYHVLK
jgi:hypothetical protein